MSDELKIVNEILSNLVNKTNIKQVMLVDHNGLPIASWDKETGKLESELENKISALAASVYLLSEKTSNIFNQGQMQQMLIQNEKGKILITNINDQSLMIAILGAKSPITLTNIEIKKASKKLRTLELLNKTIEQPDTSDIFVPSID